MKRCISLASCGARLLALLVLATVFTCWTPRAHAATAPNCTASSATLSLPSPIVVQPNAATGPISGAVGTASITFFCSGLPASNATADLTATIQAGQTLATLDPTNVKNGPGITFATGITGLALLVTATPVQATSNSCLACGPTSTAGYVPGSVVAPSGTTIGSYSGTVVANYTAQLVKTTSAAVSAGVIGPINLIPFWWYTPGGSVNSVSASLGAYLILGSTTITVPTCTVTAGNNFSVALPGVGTSLLTTAGQVAGTTAFSIAITGCPNGISVATNTFSGGTVDSNTGNLKNTATGGAQNVEVRLLNGSGGSATANSAIDLSRSSAKNQNSGTYNIVNNAVTLNYFAQYYATGAATAGAVNTSLQYTISYQ